MIIRPGDQQRGKRTRTRRQRLLREGKAAGYYESFGAPARFTDNFKQKAEHARKLYAMEQRHKVELGRLRALGKMASGAPVSQLGKVMVGVPALLGKVPQL